LNKSAANKHNALGSKSILLLTALLTYPAAIHLAVISGRPSTALLILLSPYIVLMSKRPVIRAGLALAALSGLFLLQHLPGNTTQLLLFVPPIAINAALATLFGLSLRAGETPLITRYARLLGDSLEPAVIDYTRRVTWLCALLFTAMALESLLFALFAPIEVWSLFANILNYVFVVFMFVGEYLFRRFRLAGVDHPSLPNFVGTIARVRISDIRKQ